MWKSPLDHERAYKISLIDIDSSLYRQGLTLLDCGLPGVQDETTEVGRGLVDYDRKKALRRTETRSAHVLSLLDHPGDRRSSTSRGNGKTSLIRVILAQVGSCSQVALAVATFSINSIQHVPSSARSRRRLFGENKLYIALETTGEWVQYYTSEIPSEEAGGRLRKLLFST
ncbi:hypothetical protein J6590_086480 [Homalodisca vitripennis]|nr:hypothetical protein J6590_086480 [Homalodisca vitripennis]